MFNDPFILLWFNLAVGNQDTQLLTDSSLPQWDGRRMDKK